MKARIVDWSLIFFVILEVATGLWSFLIGREQAQGVFVLHDVAGLAMLVLLMWKFRRVGRRVIGATRWDRATIVSVITSILIVVTIGTGLYWVIRQKPTGYPNGMILHTSAALLLVLFSFVHLGLRFRTPKRSDLLHRRSALGQLGALFVGGSLWGLTELGNQIFQTEGAKRRFTGSRLASGGVDGMFPVTMWMLDNPAPLAMESWRLQVTGAVANVGSYEFGQLVDSMGDEVRAILDCTGGWYTMQTWQGIFVKRLLEVAQPTSRAKYVSFRSMTGYRWALPLREANEALLAVRVNGTPLMHGHGTPMRLVAPGRRGFQWVKWVVEIRLLERSDVGQWQAIFTSGIDRGTRVGI